MLLWRLVLHHNTMQSIILSSIALPVSTWIWKNYLRVARNTNCSLNSFPLLWETATFSEKLHGASQMSSHRTLPSSFASMYNHSIASACSHRSAALNGTPTKFISFSGLNFIITKTPETRPPLLHDIWLHSSNLSSMISSSSCLQRLLFNNEHNQKFLLKCDIILPHHVYWKFCVFVKLHDRVRII